MLERWLSPWEDHTPPGKMMRGGGGGWQWFLMSLTLGFQGIIMGVIGAEHPFIDLNEGVD